MSERNIYLTSAEIGSLWSGYLQDSMSKCVLSFMLKYIEDQDIKPAIQYAYDLSSNHLRQLLTIFEKDNYAVPNGFTEQDVNMLKSEW